MLILFQLIDECFAFNPNNLRRCKALHVVLFFCFVLFCFPLFVLSEEMEVQKVCKLVRSHCCQVDIPRVVPGPSLCA